jgi:predicted flap endonuclease-1-like 5' DNA nuclease
MAPWNEEDDGMPSWLGWTFVGAVLVLWARRRRLEREHSAGFVLPPPWTATAAATEELEQPADDLGKIEGIGPKIASLLENAGVRTFAELAATDVEQLRTTLRDAGLNLADPTTWPEQAALAAGGDWEGLARLQDTLKGGRPV